MSEILVVIPISVVIPTKNRAELLEQTLRSVAAQSLRPSQIVVADDGSVDATAEVVARYGATHVRNPRGDWGAGAGRNAALERVRTEYVAFVDSDDLLLPECLELLHATLAKTPAAVLAYGRALIARRDHGGWSPCGVIAATPTEVDEAPGALYARNSVPSSGALARTAAVRAAGGYAPGARFSEDHELWIRLAQRHVPVHVPEVVSVYRLHPGNRHSPVMAARDEAEITRMADRDPRLALYRARRVGVQLCERMAEAVAARRPDQIAAVAWTLLVRQPDRRIVLRSATRHWRARRRAYRDGLALWVSRPDLRSWIAEFA